MKNLKQLLRGKKYEKMKENIRTMKSSCEFSENNTSIRENRGNAQNFFKKYFLICIKCLKSVLKHLLKTVFTIDKEKQLWLRNKSSEKKQMLKRFMIQLIKKLKANLRPKIQ